MDGFRQTINFNYFKNLKILLTKVFKYHFDFIA